MEITNNLIQDLHKAPDWFKQAIKQNYERKETAIENKKLVYQTLGDSTEDVVIVLIHGTGAHKNWWSPLGSLLEGNHYLIVPDLPGMGESDFHDAYSFPLFQKAIEHILEIESCSHKKVVLIGHSLGGHIAGYMVSERKGFYEGMVMIDTPIRPPTYDYTSHKASIPIRKIKYYEDKLTILNRFRLMPPQDCVNNWYLRYIAEHSIKETSEGWRWRFDDTIFHSLNRLHGYEFEFTCPSLFIAGGKSLLLDSRIMQYMQEAFKSSMDFEVIDNAAHHVLLDEPLLLMDVINGKLKRWMIHKTS